MLLTGCAGPADLGSGGSTRAAGTPSATRPPASEAPAPAPAVAVDSVALEAAYPDGATRISVGGGPERLDVHVDTVGLPARDGFEAGELTFTVWLIAPDPSGALGEFRAPSPNFGA